MQRGASRLDGVGESIFTTMTALAVQHDAINLGQGFPDDDPPVEVVAAAKAALDAGHHQYAPAAGVTSLRAAIADHQRDFYDLHYDPEHEITVTFGATEALAATLFALCEPGDEVLTIEPVYDAYPALIAFAGGIERRVPLTPPGSTDRGRAASGNGGLGNRWTLDIDRLAAAISPRTRLIILNDPHNPTGMMLHGATRQAIAELCVAHDLLVVTDEVYEHLVYDADHVPIASLPGMRERTVTISGAGKTFSCTGWKVGWACAPPALTDALRTTKQFLSFAGGTPLQHAIAAALSDAQRHTARLATVHRQRRDRLVSGLAEAGLPASHTSATYFVTADLAAWGIDDAASWCRTAPEQVGVAAVPLSAFVADPASVRTLVRFAFCKPDAVIDEGIRRLKIARGRT